MSKLFFNRLSSNYERFSNDTNITGFKELFNAKSIVFKLIWLVILVFGICFTIYECWYSLNNYLETPTNTVVQQFSGEPKYPPLKICYAHWIFWLDWAKFRSLKLTLNRDSFLYGMSFAKTVFIEDPTFDYASAKANFEKMMVENNYSTLSSYYFSIARDSPVDVNVKSHDIQFERNFHDFFGSELCYSTEIDFMHDKGSSKSKRGQIVKMTFNFDYSLKFDYITDLEVNYYRLAAFAYESSNKNKIVLYGNESRVFVAPMMYVDGTDDQLMPDPNYFQYVLRLKGSVYNWLGAPNRPCNVYPNVTFNGRYGRLCERACELQDKVKSQSCLKFSDVSSSSNLGTFSQVCTQDVVLANRLNGTSTLFFGKAFNVALTNETDYDDDIELDHQGSCYTNCTKSCNEWTYETAVVTNLRPAQTRDQHMSSTYVEIQYPVPDTIIVMTETPSKTWQDLLSDVGGLLGLWVGATLFSFAQIIYFCCCFECDEWCARLYTKSATEFHMYKSRIRSVHTVNGNMGTANGNVSSVI